MRHPLLLPALTALLLTGCSEDNPLHAGLNKTEACRAVKERLDARGIATRFGKPDTTQDFFGDSVLSFDRVGVRWEFQVSATAGTYRALQVKGAQEQVLSCPP